MKILIAEDETPAREELKYILSQMLPNAELHEAKNGLEVIEILMPDPTAFDVLFLDINMPGKDGLGVASEIVRWKEDGPLIVFATAYSEHAVEAFEYAALDYIVKPFDEKRLQKTIDRIQAKLSEPKESQNEALQAYLTTLTNQITETQKSRAISKLWGEKENGNRLLVDFSDIFYVEAEAKRVYIFTVGGEKLQVRQTLKELDDRLSLNEFARVHKGYLVNLNHINEVVPWFSGGYLIKIGPAGDIEIPMSRRYAAKLKELTDW